MLLSTLCRSQGNNIKSPAKAQYTVNSQNFDFEIVDIQLTPTINRFRTPDPNGQNQIPRGVKPKIKYTITNTLKTTAYIVIPYYHYITTSSFKEGIGYVHYDKRCKCYLADMMPEVTYGKTKRVNIDFTYDEIINEHHALKFAPGEKKEITVSFNFNLIPEADGKFIFCPYTYKDGYGKEIDKGFVIDIPTKKVIAQKDFVW